MKFNLAFLLCSLLFSCSAEEIETYKIMTYNIRYDNPNDGQNQWSQRKEFLKDQISYYEVDIFGVQEALYHQVSYLDTFFYKYSYIGVGRDDGKEKGEYCAIFYNSNKFICSDSGTFWLSQTPDKISVGWDASMERICTYGLFKTRHLNNEFFVFNTHLDHLGELARLQSLKLIVRKILELNTDKLPLVLMGDFNLKPESTGIVYLRTVLNDSKELSLEKPFGPNGTFNGFQFQQAVVDRIDYIFVDKEQIRINKYAVLSDSKNCRYPSDHLPVLLDVQFK